MKCENALIKDADVFIEDHGILTATLLLDFGNSQQGFGGYALDNANCAVFIRHVLTTVGVERWSDLDGESIRVRSENGRIIAIGHFILDKWFDPSEVFKQ